jgi:hypothetical protein
MSNLVHNEQTKMLASLFNNLGVASLATGILAPAMSARPSATPVGVSEGGHAIFFAGLTGNAIGSMVFGVVCFVFFGWIATVILTLLKE